MLTKLLHENSSPPRIAQWWTSPALHIRGNLPWMVTTSDNCKLRCGFCPPIHPIPVNFASVHGWTIARGATRCNACSQPIPHRTEVRRHSGRLLAIAPGAWRQPHRSRPRCSVDDLTNREIDESAPCQEHSLGHALGIGGQHARARSSEV